VGQRLRHELVQFAVISVYLFVCFGAIVLYKMAILHAAASTTHPMGWRRSR
jgi:hypothetical protein